MNWWDNIPGQSQQGGGGWWQQTQPMQYPGAIQPPGAMAQPSPSAPKWIGAGVPATGFLRMIQGIMQGGQQAQQPITAQGIGQQQPQQTQPPPQTSTGFGGMSGLQTTVKPPAATLSPLGPEYKIINGYGYNKPLAVGGIYRPTSFQTTSKPVMFWGLPQGPGLPWNKPGFDMTPPDYSRSGLMNPAPYQTQTAAPKPPTQTGGGGGGEYSGGYFSGSGYSYKAPKQPWYMELMSWNIGE